MVPQHGGELGFHGRIITRAFAHNGNVRHEWRRPAARLSQLRRRLELLVQSGKRRGRLDRKVQGTREARDATDPVWKRCRGADDAGKPHDHARIKTARRQTGVQQGNVRA